MNLPLHRACFRGYGGGFIYRLFFGDAGVGHGRPEPPRLPSGYQADFMMLSAGTTCSTLTGAIRNHLLP